MHLSELKIGFTDGEEESRQPNFSQYYYDYNNYVEKSLEPQIYLVAGRRGTGKTALSFYLEKEQKCYNHFITRISYKELTPASFRKNNQELRTGSLYQLFRWLFLLELSKILLDSGNEILGILPEYKLLKDLSDKNYEFKNPHKASLISQIINNGLKVKFGSLAAGTSLGELELNPGVKGQLTDQSVVLFYDNLFQIIKPLVAKAAELDVKFTILLDDIDDHMSSDEESRRILEDLINAVYGFNGEIRNLHNGSKILLFIRSDVFNRITIANKHKILDDHTIILQWDTRSDINSPLLELIVKRLKTNCGTAFRANEKTEDILYRLFPGKVTYKQTDGAQRSIDGYTFILRRTHYRPRDIIRYLRFIQEKYPHIKEFSGFAIHGCERVFSDWLKSDIENELAIHYDQKTIADLFGIAGRLRAWKFGLKRLMHSYECRNEVPPIEIEAAMIILYKFGIVGQYYQSEDSEVYFNFFYHDTDAPYNNPNFFLNDFILHPGLQSSLMKGDFYKASQLYNSKPKADKP
ncbi:MAG TPA: hypothetical protein PLK82_09520 [Bacteroidales bacterium]|nr:hypothetical protein [Bacteroidales bacterium]